MQKPNLAEPRAAGGGGDGIGRGIEACCCHVCGGDVNHGAWLHVSGADGEDLGELRACFRILCLIVIGQERGLEFLTPVRNDAISAGNDD